jgi:hypothetical protein
MAGLVFAKSLKRFENRNCLIQVASSVDVQAAIQRILMKVAEIIGDLVKKNPQSQHSKIISLEQLGEKIKEIQGIMIVILTKIETGKKGHMINPQEEDTGREALVEEEEIDTMTLRVEIIERTTLLMKI